MIAVQLLNITGRKRKLMQVNFGAMSNRSCSLCKVAYNVLQIGEVAEIEAQMFGLALHFNRCTYVQLTTKTAILPNCCYAYVAVNLG
jgi:hypothetical protein